MTGPHDADAALLERLVDLVEVAMGRARQTRAVLETRVLPVVPRNHWSATAAVIGRLADRDITEAQLPADLTTLADVLERAAAEGITRYWRHDDGATDGWWDEHRTPEAQALTAGAVALRALAESLAAIDDYVATVRISVRLYYDPPA